MTSQYSAVVLCVDALPWRPFQHCTCQEEGKECMRGASVCVRVRAYVFVCEGVHLFVNVIKLLFQELKGPLLQKCGCIGVTE